MDGDKRFTICRLCLSGNDTLTYVFETKGIHGFAPADVITELLRHEVSSEDIYPQCVCSECLRKLNDFKKFKEQCETSKGLLDRAYASKHVPSTEISPTKIHTRNDWSQEEFSSHAVDVVSADIPLMEPKVELDEEGEWDAVVDEMGMVAKEGPSSTKDVLTLKKRVHRNAPNSAVEVITADIPLLKPKIEPDDGSDHEPVIEDVGIVAQDEARDMRVVLALKKHGERYASNSAVELITADIPLLKPKIEPDEGSDYEPVADNVGMFTRKETEGTIDGGARDPFASADSDDERLSIACRWKADPDEPDSDINEKECAGDADTSPSKDSKCPSHSTNKKEEPKKTSLKCPECNKECVSKQAYNRHMRIHKFGRNFKCDECGKCFADKTSIRSHLLTHSVEKVNCEICGKALKNKNALRNHMVLHRDKKFKCEQCGREFFRRFEFKLHVTIHTKEKFLACEICSKLFKHNKALMQHMVLHGEKNYICDKCGKAFIRLRDLKIHKTIHIKEKVHFCKVCGKSFHNKSILRSHKYTHEGGRPKKYSCTECEGKFPCPADLRNHMRRHTGEKPFSCPECDECFSWKCDLQKHAKKHEGSSLVFFDCAECGVHCPSLHELELHRKSSHAVAKEFKCVVCGNEYTQKRNLNAHVKKKHSQKW